MTGSGYVGRFAPSPTGPLHFGSLVAAVGSCLEARSRGGRWHLRMEDLDTPRCSPDAAGHILRTLEALGFEWDGDVGWQSACIARYRDTLDSLIRAGHAYPCACTRREIADSGMRGIEGPVYRGTCRDGIPQGGVARAFRVRTDRTEIAFDDRIQGRVAQRLESDVGDFVLLRADGVYAYQFAVVVDDADMRVTDVVRGADLIASTPRQIHLQRLLGLPTPSYAHLPVAVNTCGEKLSKQTFAPAVNARDGVPALDRAMMFLGHPAPADLGSLRDFWAWAVAAWDMARVPRVHTAPVPAS